MKKKTKSITFKHNGKETTAKLSVYWPIGDDIAKKCSNRVVEMLANGILNNTPISKKFVGTAVCDDEDVYCIEDGNVIAHMKAYRKYHEFCAKELRKILDNLADTYAELRELEAYHWRKSNNITESMNRRYLN